MTTHLEVSTLGQLIDDLGPAGSVVAPDKLHIISQEHTSVVPRWFHILRLIDFYASKQTVVDSGSIAMFLRYIFVWVSNSFVHSSTSADYGYHSFGQLARLFYCLLQKIKEPFPLPLVEQREEYVTPNHSRFPAIDEEDFLARKCKTTALKKVGSHFLRNEFHLDARRFLEEIVNCFFSTVASRSLIRQSMSCFCPANVNGGDDFASFQLFKKL